MTQKVSLLWYEAIIVDHSRNNKNKKANKNKLGLKGVVSKRKTKIQGKSFNCDKMGHKSSNKDC